MAFTLNDGQGTLHKNKQKDEGSKQPDYRGDLMLDGVLYQIGAWLKDGKSGKWMSLKVEVARERSDTAAPARAAVAPGDDIPF